VSARFVYKIKPNGDVIGRTSIILTIFPHFWFQKILETAMEPIKKFAKSFPSSTVSKLTESAQSWLTHSNKIRGGRGETGRQLPFWRAWWFSAFTFQHHGTVEAKETFLKRLSVPSSSCSLLQTIETPSQRKEEREP
jgi:hypothetical protein